MTSCPHCGAPKTRIVRSRMNAGRVLASIVLVPFYLFGGMAGDERGPLLPLERRCPECGRRSKGRSVVDDLHL